MLTVPAVAMGDFTLPSLPPNFVPNFLTQPPPINNDTNLLDNLAGFNPIQQSDPSRGDHFPKDVDGDSPFLDELDTAFNNLSQTDEDTTLSTEQWIEVSTLYAQAMRHGLVNYTKGIGAASFTRNLSLESRIHCIELSKNIESINRYFQLPYDETMSTKYCHKCLTADGTIPTQWQTLYEICGHDATATRDTLINEYRQILNTQMLEWYESMRSVAHDQIILKITNGEFAPEFIRADPRIIEWAN